MKSKIIVASTFGLLISCAPHIDYYKPVSCIEMQTFENSCKIHDHYYLSHTDESLQVRTNLLVGSLPKTKEIYFRIGFVDSIKVDSVVIESNRIKIRLNHEKTNDSIFTDGYFEKFEMNDWKWYSRFEKKKDTFNVSVYYNNKMLKIPYYFNHRNRLETYPF